VLDRTKFFRSTRTHPEEERLLDRELADVELVPAGGNGNGDNPTTGDHA